MAPLTLILTALGLSADCFAVAVSGSCALVRPTRLQTLRTALAFGLAQSLMALDGWAGGREVAEFIADFDHWVAFALLAIIGGHMLREAAEREEGSDPASDITTGPRLVVLAIATSIDSLAVGLTLAFLQVDIVLASSVIGATAFVVTVAGFAIGARLGALAGRQARLVGGLILIAIGVKTVLEHTIL
jgi:putative Mn2+ efflux pump MntP